MHQITLCCTVTCLYLSKSLFFALPSDQFHYYSSLRGATSLCSMIHSQTTSVWLELPLTVVSPGYETICTLHYRFSKSLCFQVINGSQFKYSLQFLWTGRKSARANDILQSHRILSANMCSPISERRYNRTPVMFAIKSCLSFLLACLPGRILGSSGILITGTFEPNATF